MFVGGLSIRTMAYKLEQSQTKREKRARIVYERARKRCPSRFGSRPIWLWPHLLAWTRHCPPPVLAFLHPPLLDARIISRCRRLDPQRWLGYHTAHTNTDLRRASLLTLRRSYSYPTSNGTKTTQRHSFVQQC